MQRTVVVLPGMQSRLSRSVRWICASMERLIVILTLVVQVAKVHTIPHNAFLLVQ